MGLFKGKLKGLFKKKVGGSVVGNVLRGVGDKFTGGLYSSIFPRPTEVGSGVQPADKSKPYVKPKPKPKPKSKAYIAYIVGGLVGLAGLIAVLFKGKNNKRKWKS